MFRRLQLFAMLAASLFAAGAMAQTFPAKPIHVIVGYPAGHVMDISFRYLTPEMGKRLGQSILVENRPGAGGGIGINAVKTAAPDGYTLACCTFPNLHPIFVKTNAVVGGKDLSPIGDYAAAQITFLVRGSLGPKTFAELVAYSKANPGKLNYASLSDLYDLIFEVIKARTGITGTTVRYNGSVIQEMLRGEVDIVAAQFPIAQIKTGQIVALFASGRIPGYQIPVTSEVGLPRSVLTDSRFGIWGPGALSIDIRRRIAADMAAALQQPGVDELWEKLNFTKPPEISPEEQQRVYDERIAGFAEGAKLNGYQPK